jgi:hypothetical protein
VGCCLLDVERVHDVIVERTAEDSEDKTIRYIIHEIKLMETALHSNDGLEGFSVEDESARRHETAILTHAERLVLLLRINEGHIVKSWRRKFGVQDLA